MHAIVSHANKKASVVKTYLSRLREETDKLQEASTMGITNEIIIRENLINTLSSQTIQCVNELQKSQQECKNAIKMKTKRQIQITSPDLSSEEVNKVIETGLANDVLRKAILNVILLLLLY